MRVLVALAWLAACVGRAHAAIANIDTDGFTQDGKTTYCEGITEAKGPLVFEHLLPSSAGKCPLKVELTTTRRTNSATGATEIWVDWSASRAASVAPASSLFPRAVDAATGLPQPVIASLLRACKAGSNCATDTDVLVPAAVAGSETSTGDFDASGKKALRRFVFGLGSAAADLVLVAKVVLPGDALLNISATEFITFQRVRVGSDTVLPGTVKPSDTQASEAATVAGEAKTPPSSKPLTQVDAEDTTNGALTTPTKGGTTNIIVLSSIAGLGFIIAVAYFATAKRGDQHGTDHHEDAQHTSTSDVSIYQLTDAAVKTEPTRTVPLAPPRGPATKPLSGQPPSRRFQTRQQHTQAPWTNPAARADPTSVVALHEELPPALYHADLSADGLIVSSHAEPSTSRGTTSDLLGSQLTSFNSLHDSDALASQLLSFNSLHDSAVTLPETSRQRRASSASSYADELDDSDRESVDVDANMSSRLFTETHISEVLQYQRSTAASSDDRSTQLSTVSWLQEEDADLVELTTVIHERYPPRRR